MRLITSVLALTCAIPVLASGPIPVVELTPALAKELGFEISIEPEGEFTMVKLVGPIELNNGCLPSSTGNYVLGPEGKEVVGYRTWLGEVVAERPKLVAYIANDSPNTLGVYIDYFCPEGRTGERRRYHIRSIRKWGP